MSSLSNDLAELRQQAEQLRAEVTKEGESSLSVRRNPQQLSDFSRKLLDKQPTATDQSNKVNASIFLGSRGYDVSKQSQRLEMLNAAKTLEPIEPTWETDIEGFLRNERENNLLAVIEESRTNTFHEADKRQWRYTMDQWEREKDKILESLLGPASQDLPEITWKTGTIEVDPLSFHGRTSLDTVEMAYSRELYRANEVELNDLSCALFSKFYDASRFFNDKSIRDSWLLLKMLLDVELPSKAYEYRLSAKIQKGFVYQSRHFLEQQYLEYVRELVYANLNKAQLGGVPGTRKLIESFLKLRPLAPGLEDGLSDDGQPLWAVVFYCMRCGDLQAAADVLHNIPHLNEIYQYVMAYTSSQDLRLPPNYENKLRLLYKKSVRASTDPYKRAVYCILGRCELNDDHSQVIVKTEDYMWLKLCQVNCESKSDQLPLSKLQFFILKECGESHFDAQRNPHLYFQVLLLTAQFEAAIEFMYRVESLRSHAVHFALALYDQELLHLTSSFNSNLLRDEPNGILRLNIGKLVVNYTRKFCLTDPREAVEYFYRLRHLKDGKDMNLFFSCISELALESREPGYIDKFAPVKSSDVANEIVESVAREAETRGQFEDALRLYDLAQDHGKVLQLSCHLMGGVVSSPSPPQSDRHRLQTLCTSIAERYRNHGYAPKYEISHTFFLLLDLMTFFDRYHSKAFDEALKIIQQLRLLPLLDEETVDQKITSFKTMDDLVRLCFPDLLLAVMNILYAQYKQSSTTTHPPMIDSGEEIFKSNIRQTAHRLIMFVGMVPYQMPGDVNARLVQLEVLMN